MRHRILLIDDEPDIRTVASAALQRLGGFDVMACAGAAEALASAGAFAPDLLLLDVMMPGIDGVDTLQRLRRIDGLAEVPAIFMTAKTQLAEIEHLHGRGVLGVVTKPFDPVQLALEVHRLATRGCASTSSTDVGSGAG